MTFQEQRNKYEESEKIRKTFAEAMEPNSRRLVGDQETPIFTVGTDQEVIAQGKAATKPKRYRKRVHKGSGSGVGTTPGNGHFVEVELGNLAGGQASSDVQRDEVRPKMDGKVPMEESAKISGIDILRRAASHHPTYKFPQDKDGMDAPYPRHAGMLWCTRQSFFKDAVADELGNMPEMIGFDLTVPHPVKSSFGHAVVNDLSDPRRLAELELEDPSEIFNLMGQALCKMAVLDLEIANQLEASIKDRSELEKKLAKEGSQKDSELAKLSELKDELKKKNEELTAENAQLVANAKDLRDENCRLNEKVVMYKRQAVEAYKDSNRGLFHVLRVAAAEGQSR